MMLSPSAGQASYPCAGQAPHNELRWNRAGSRHQVFLKTTVPSKLAPALAPGGCHPTSSKLTSSLASTAKSLFLLRKSTQKKSGFSVPPTGGPKINRVGGNGEMLVPLS